MRKKLIPIAVALTAIALLLFGLLPQSAEAADEWWDDNWVYRQKLIFLNGGQAEDLLDFPVLVKLTPGKIDYSKTQADGADIRFIDSGTELKYEIEEWDETGDSWVWVKVPQIDKQSYADYMYIYYGNPDALDDQDPEGVWSTDYRMVQHLKDKTTSTTEDSTSYNNDGTKKAANDPNEVDGKIGKGQNFVGANNEWIRVTRTASLEPANICLEAWIKFDESQEDISLVSRLDSEAGYGLYQAYLAANWIEWFIVDTLSGTYQQARFAWSEISPPTPTGWHYIVGTYDGEDNKIYLDGDLKQTNGTPDGDIDYKGFTPDLFLAADPSGNSPSTPGIMGFDGQMDEVRISGEACSADWVKAQYLSMTDDFITFGWEEKWSPPVGGEAYPVNKLAILAPWLALIAAIIAGTSILIRRRRVQG